MGFMQTIYHWLYCMDIPDLVLLLILVTTGVRFLRDYLRTRSGWRIPFLIFLVGWGVALFYATLGDRSVEQGIRVEMELFHSYREVWNGGNPEIFRSNFMNMVLFYPGGLLLVLLLPQKWPLWFRCILTVVLLVPISVWIETVQYRFAFGRCEIDDVFHNTAGALLGSVTPFLCIIPRRFYDKHL